MAANKKKPVTPDQKREAEKLKAIWKEHKARHSHCTQTYLADRFAMTQGAVYQYLAGIIPLNLEIALKFASEFGVNVNEFSPSLAAEWGPRIPNLDAISDTRPSPSEATVARRVWIKFCGVPDNEGLLNSDPDFLVERSLKTAWLSSDHEAFGIVVIGQGLAPRYDHREVAIVEPSRTPRPGDEILIHHSDGTMRIAKFIEEVGDVVTTSPILTGSPKRTYSRADLISLEVITARTKRTD